MSNRDADVILACLKLARAMRRIPPERREYPFPPAVGRLLDCAAKNPGVSSRELCEFLDVRPSSLSEILSRAEADGFITRTVDEDDRRVQRINLSNRGRKAVSDMEAARNREAGKMTSCLTDEEKEQFCALCDKLSTHMERMALDLPEDFPRPPRPPRPGDFPRPDHPDRDDPDAPLRRPLPRGGRIKC